MSEERLTGSLPEAVLGGEEGDPVLSEEEGDGGLLVAVESGGCEERSCVVDEASG